MNMNYFGMPGPDGSIGMCALCGEPFLSEIFLGTSVKSFRQAGSSTTFYAHDKCLKDAESCKTLLDLPAASPLRQAYEKQQAKAAAEGHE